jgi:hypothetical protein
MRQLAQILNEKSISPFKVAMGDSFQGIDSYSFYSPFLLLVFSPWRVLKGLKHEIFGSRFITPSKPICVGDFRTDRKNNFFPRIRCIF